MKIIKTLLFVMFFSTGLLSQPVWEWASSTTGIPDEFGEAISTDPMGNSYITGYFKGTANFGNHSVISYGDQDVFIAKYSPSGNCIWVQHGGGTSFDVAKAVAIDAAGNCYVTGAFSGLATFGMTTVIGNYSGSVNIFLVKYDTNGNLVWARCNADSTGSIYSNAVAVDSAGNAWITGYTYASPHTFGSHTLYGLGGYVVKYDPNGNIVYAEEVGDDFGFLFRDITVDQAGNAYVCGTLVAPDTINGQAFACSNPNPNGFGFDALIIKLDASGNFVWLRQAYHSGTSYHGSEALTIDFDKQSHIYIGCSFDDIVAFDSDTLYSLDTLNNDGEMAVVKYDLDGNEIWARQSVSNGQGPGFITGINYSESSARLNITGYYESNLAFGNVTLNAIALYGNAFMAAYDSAGVCLFAVTPTTQTYGPFSSGVSSDSSGGIYFTGGFHSDVSFGNFTTTATTPLGYYDVFVAKLQDYLQAVPENSTGQFSFFTSPDGFHLTSNNYEILQNNLVLKICDMTGRVVKEVSIIGPQMLIDNSELAPGIYIWQVQSLTGQLAAGKTSTF